MTTQPARPRLRVSAAELLPPDLPASARGSETRDRILKAAAKVLIAGDGQCEIADVARAAGVSAGLSYHYFTSKAGLIAAVVEAFYDRMEAAVMEPNPKPGAGWGERERLRLERMVDFYYGEPLAPLILTRLSRTPDVAAVEAARLARHIDLAARNVELAQQKGEIPTDLDAHLLGAMILGGLRQAIGQVLGMTKRPTRDKITDQLWSFIAGTAQLKPVKKKAAR
ncbi:TetR/AcrR family transcriptional regulator [Ferrovibrio terrae]|uniref:TetR/AcrR family transcriptional regulator n=1 Tax=Ferrovibrio terrae TaxID=2594003 RepID=A0A516H462_9PROT|nr:TetR/AcrR family transcriptional regulator [Ferrovibrio terrae]QDO98535.1 TetR/AcrR family transcriptional regulator [Ferrovibrio terrae]